MISGIEARAVGILAVALFAFGCSQTEHPVAIDDGSTALRTAAASSTSPTDRAAALATRVNARFEAAGSPIRVDEAWLFTVGSGTDPFRRLRTGSRWIPSAVAYMLDESDYTNDEPFAAVDDALESAYDSWNAIRNSGLTAIRIPDGGGNVDILDGIILDGDGNCVDVVDLGADNLISYNPNTGALSFVPAAHIVVGGWVDPAYFEDCLGSASIIGVTWTFSIPDQNGDNYRDRLYVEQFYNPAFAWTTTDAVYLDFGAPIDIETIAVHENGHAHGLGHFGGPNVRQPFKLKPNGKVFNPEAVMNPFYLGGEERVPLKTDVAGMITLYGSF